MLMLFRSLQGLSYVLLPPDGFVVVPLSRNGDNVWFLRHSYFIEPE